MINPPFELISCSWPRPVEQVDNCWASEPEWDAPEMPVRPEPAWSGAAGEPCWMIDWAAHFLSGLRPWSLPPSGEMRRFHVLFRIRITAMGRLVFWDDDGSIVRRGGRIIHEDRSVHPLVRHELDVEAGEELEIAQWQSYGGWQWGARLELAGARDPNPGEVLGPYLDVVHEALRRPNGPPLKLFTHGGQPARAILCVYSMVLNGYRPGSVHLFGEHQWTAPVRGLFNDLLPFAEVVPTADVVQTLRAHGVPQLAAYAPHRPMVMKWAVGVMSAPHEFCQMDDDLFMLDRADHALDAFRTHELVYCADTNYEERYLKLWGWMTHQQRPLPTASLNAGLYWLRNQKDRRQLAAHAARVAPAPELWDWEQAFVAVAFGGDRTFALPGNRYFYPVLDGMPGGMLGYDYAANPCRFVSLHFGGLQDKPSDSFSLSIAPGILERQTALHDR